MLKRKYSFVNMLMCPF